MQESAPLHGDAEAVRPQEVERVIARAEPAVALCGGRPSEDFAA